MYFRCKTYIYYYKLSFVIADTIVNNLLNAVDKPWKSYFETEQV